MGGVAASWQRGHATPSPVTLAYVVRVIDPATQRFEVELEASGLGSGDFQLGFSTNALRGNDSVDRFRVREALDAAGRPVPVQRDATGWRFRSSGAVLRVVYEANWSAGQGRGDFSDDALSGCDPDGARIYGSDVFLFPLRHAASSIRARYEFPADWQLVHPFQISEFEASYPDLRSLYYSVAAAGRLRTLSRIVDGCELVLAARGRFRFGDRDLMDVIERIVEQQFAFFGEAPRTRYVFVVNEHHDTENPRQLHYFGLHFDGSMSILLDPRTDRTRLQAEPAQIIAHEFFHNWNGELVTQDGYDMNWFVEGVTTYYAYQTVRAIDMLDNGNYARALHERYDAHYLNNRTRTQYSLAEAGQIVLQDADVTRYLYGAGALAALALDEQLRSLTRQRVDLDDVMRELVLRAQLSGERHWTLTREGLEDVLLELTGSDFRPWISRYIYGKETLPLPEYVVEAAR